MSPWAIWGFFPVGKLEKALDMDEPPTIYYLMRGMCDYEKSFLDQTPIRQLAEKTHHIFFYDTYPLSENINKDVFEVDILNHFLHRRINHDTFTGFRIALVNKMREIMPKYNLMFALYADDDIFYDTENEKFNSKKINEGGYLNKNNSITNSDKNTSGINDVTDRKNGTENEDVSENEVKRKSEDLRFSDTPQNRLSDIQAGEYISEYRYNQINENNTKNTNRNKTSSDTINTHGVNTGNENSKTTGNSTLDNSHNDTDTFNHNKDVRKKVNLLEKLKVLEEYKNIMTLIYNDLDELFLQVFDY